MSHLVWRLLKCVVPSLLAAFLLSCYLSDTLFFYIGNRFVWLTAAVVLGLGLVALSYLLPERARGHEGHNHGNTLTALGLLLILLPVVLGWLVPHAPLLPNTGYRAAVAARLASGHGRTVHTPVEWQFRTRAHRLLGLGRIDGQPHELLLWRLDGAPPLVLAAAEDGIWDYASAPDGRRVVYAALRPDGGTDLWLASLRQDEPLRLIDCGGANCTGAAWSPDGSQVLYERRDVAGPPRLWWLGPKSGETEPMFEDPQLLGFGARWSPDGRWINYVEPLQGVRLFNLETGDSVVVPRQMGEPGTWSPGSDRVAVTDIRPQGEEFAVHVLVLALATEEIRDLSGADSQVDDSSPAWSPDGRWIAFGRKSQEAGAGVGSRVWLATPDGSNLRPLTNDPEAHCGAMSWSPDSRFLAAQRYQVDGPAADPTLVVFDITTGAAQELGGGASPIWLQ